MVHLADRPKRPQTKDRSPTAHQESAQSVRSPISPLARRSPLVQPKLTVNQPNDQYEQEADAVASAVTSTPAPLPQPDQNRTASLQRMAIDADQDVLQRAAIAEKEDTIQRQPEEKEQTIQRKGVGQPKVSNSTTATIRSPGTGKPLPNNVRHRIEPHVGANLSGVRVHTDTKAQQAASSLNARAFTHGNNIFLNRSESSHNLGLMAHESTHVVQQGAAPIQRLPLEETSPSVQRTPVLSSAAPSIQRWEITDLPGIDANDVDAIIRQVPGYLFFTVMVGYDPLRNRDVAFNAINLIEGLMGLAGPPGIFVFDALQEYGVLQSAFDWTSRELSQRDLTSDRIQRIINSIDISDIALNTLTGGVDYVISELLRYFQPLINDAIAFVDSLVDQVIELIKEAAIAFAEPLLARNRAWDLIKKVIHYDPLRDEEVDATPVEILEDFLLLIGKEQELEQMRERGTLQETADWLSTQIGTFMSLLETLRGLVTDVWNAIQPENLPNLGSNLENLAGRVVGFLAGVWTFASTVALKVLELIKNALLGWLSTYANEIPGYHLLTVLLEKDPFTQEAVPRNATNLIRGFISLIPGGEQQFQQMQETGVISQAAQRIEGLMTELGITWPFVQQLFLDIWNDFTIEDLLSPIDAFIRVLQRFEEPLTRLFTFVIEVIKVVVELILVLMNFPTDLIGSIITNAMQALDDIQQNPVGFLINLLETAKLGFQKFFDNIFENLLGGLTDWLFSAVREAGVEPPADFSFESILGFVLDVLGLTMDHMWELLANHIGQERVDQIRGAIDRVMEIAREAWGFIQDVQERGMVAVWEYIESQLTNLWDIVLQQVQDYVMERVINVGMRWLMSLLDATGITPVINSFVAFFNAIQSAIQYLREMLEVVNDFVSTVASIARGDIEPGATRMEQGLKNSIPIVIGFIANQLGLGDLGQRLGEIIESIRGVVDQALNWLIEQALNLGRAVLAQLGFGSGEVASEAEQQAEHQFSFAGESHTIRGEFTGRTVRFLMASNMFADIDVRLRELDNVELYFRDTDSTDIANQVRGTIDAIRHRETSAQDQIASAPEEQKASLTATALSEIADQFSALDTFLRTSTSLGEAATVRVGDHVLFYDSSGKVKSGGVVTETMGRLESRPQNAQNSLERVVVGLRMLASVGSGMTDGRLYSQYGANKPNGWALADRPKSSPVNNLNPGSEAIVDRDSPQFGTEASGDITSTYAVSKGFDPVLYKIKGHLVARVFGGPGGITSGNIVPMTQNANSLGSNSMWKGIERPVLRDIVGHNAVYRYKAVPIYGEGVGKPPTEIHVTKNRLWPPAPAPIPPYIPNNNPYVVKNE